VPAKGEAVLDVPGNPGGVLSPGLTVLVELESETNEQKKKKKKNEI
jgi:hypothetical protein